MGSPRAYVDLAHGEVLVTRVDSFELAAVNRYQRLAEQLQITAQNYESSAYIADARAVVPPEVSDRFEVRCQASCEPHQFHIALRFTL